MPQAVKSRWQTLGREKPLWGRGRSEDRAQSIAVSHAILLSFVFTLIIGIAAAGSGPIIDAQSEVISSIATDNFEDWEDSVIATIRSGDPQRQTMTVPTGGYVGGGEPTTITITNLDSGGSKQITSDWFRHSPRGSKASVIYDAGLLTKKNSEFSRPSVKSSPEQTVYTTSGRKVVTLNLVEYDLKSSVVFQTAYSREFMYNIYPNASHTVDLQHGVGSNTRIEIQGPNYDSWERYFHEHEDTGGSGIYTNIAVEKPGQTVQADVQNTDFRLNSRYVYLNQSNTNL